MSVENGPQPERIAPLQPGKLRHFVFDVDDTLQRGVMDIKDAVWHEMYADRLDVIKQAMRIFDKEVTHDADLGDGPQLYQGDRLEIIAFMQGKWHPTDRSYRDDAEVLAAAEEFKVKTNTAIRTMGINDADRAALATLRQKFPSAQFHIVSNVPEDVLRENMEAMGIADQFHSIIGTPTKKIDALKHIAEVGICETSELLMVGDGSNDYEAARLTGTQFVGIETKRNQEKDWWSNNQFDRVANVAALPELLSQKAVSE